MAKIGYIMAISQYDRLEEDRKWMNDYGCIRIVEESDENERNRPLWKQLMVALQRGDELVISKFSNALRGSRELATFLEFCRVKVIRIVSIDLMARPLQSMLRRRIARLQRRGGRRRGQDATKAA